MKALSSKLPLLLPYWPKLSLALLAVFSSGLLSVLRPWPLKVVIDQVLSRKPKHSHLPLLQAWLEGAHFTPWQILYGACAATLLFAESETRPVTADEPASRGKVQTGSLIGSFHLEHGSG